MTIGSRVSLSGCCFCLIQARRFGGIDEPKADSIAEGFSNTPTLPSPSLLPILALCILSDAIRLRLGRIVSSAVLPALRRGLVCDRQSILLLGFITKNRSSCFKVGRSGSIGRGGSMYDSSEVCELELSGSSNGMILCCTLVANLTFFAGAVLEASFIMRFFADVGDLDLFAATWSMLVDLGFSILTRPWTLLASPEDDVES